MKAQRIVLAGCAAGQMDGGALDGPDDNELNKVESLLSLLPLRDPLTLAAASTSLSCLLASGDDEPPSFTAMIIFLPY